MGAVGYYIKIVPGDFGYDAPIELDRGSAIDDCIVQERRVIIGQADGWRYDLYVRNYGGIMVDDFSVRKRTIVYRRLVQQSLVCAVTADVPRTGSDG